MQKIADDGMPVEIYEHEIYDPEKESGPCDHTNVSTEVVGVQPSGQGTIIAVCGDCGKEGPAEGTDTIL